MPFDSKPEVTNPMVEGLDRVLALFGEKGEGWVQNTLYVPALKKYCIDGGIRAAFKYSPHNSADPRCNYGLARSLVSAHVPGGFQIEAFNDQFGRQFSEVRDLIVKAREAARANPKFAKMPALA